MTRDYFKFWTEVPADARIHPEDNAVFNRLNKNVAEEEKVHSFDLDCLPLNFAGPLKTAKVVLLYLSPGLGVDDAKFAAENDYQSIIAEQRTGTAMLPGDASALGHEWRKSRLKFLGDWESKRDMIATMNIGAYHSKGFLDHDVLASLPTSRAALDWAQSVLFPEAEAGERVVICMRSARYWGLQPGNIFGKSLFVPNTTRGGHMFKNSIREQAVEAAKRMLVD